MNVTLDIVVGNDHRLMVYKSDIDKQINTLDALMKGDMSSEHFVNLLDIRSILHGIREQLPTS